MTKRAMTVDESCGEVCTTLQKMGIEDGQMVHNDVIYQVIQSVVGDSELLKLRTKRRMVDLGFLTPSQEYEFRS